MTIVKPMLAAGITEDKHYAAIAKHYPLLSSPKLDGIRLLHHPELGPVSRKFKPIPNLHIRDTLEALGTTYMDGEVITLNDDLTPRTFNEIQGDVMRVQGEPNFRFVVFDFFQLPHDPFEIRLASLNIIVDLLEDGRVMVLDHTPLADEEAVLEHLAKSLAGGYEGLMLRHPQGKYKEGRSTVNQAWLVKLKQFQDAEGKIVSFEERLHNGNEATKDATGHTERSSHRDNMVPMNTLGALALDTEWGLLKVGTGFDDTMRQEIWDNQFDYLNKIVTFTYQPFGAKDKPRFPVFKGFRPEMEG